MAVGRRGMGHDEPSQSRGTVAADWSPSSGAVAWASNYTTKGKFRAPWEDLNYKPHNGRFVIIVWLTRNESLFGGVMRLSAVHCRGYVGKRNPPPGDGLREGFAKRRLAVE